VLTGACHPWAYVEQVANREVRRDFNSVQSRLVLCKTFKLDDDGKVRARRVTVAADGQVLTPEELLYRAVTRINASHDAARVGQDVKLRSLVCAALNEQALHLWSVPSID